jgi:hypothetical protein
MRALRRTLYIQSGVWVLAGLALTIAPKFTLVTIFSQPRHQEFAWMRLLGLQAICLSMLMVLVAHRVEELWWWSWAFAFTTTAMAAVALLNAAFGLGPNESAVLWWVLSAVTLGFALGLLYGLFVSSREQPLP